MIYKRNYNLAMLFLRPLYPLIRKAIDYKAAIDQYENLNPHESPFIPHPHTEDCRVAARFEVWSILDEAFHGLHWGRPKVYRRKKRDETDLSKEELLERWNLGEPVKLVPPEEL